MTPSPPMLTGKMPSPCPCLQRRALRLRCLLRLTPTTRLWKARHYGLFSIGSVGDLDVWLDGRSANIRGGSQGVGCVVKRGRPIGKDMCFSFSSCWPEIPVTAHPYAAQHLLLSHPSCRQMGRPKCYLNLTSRNTQTVQCTRCKTRQYTR